jgi:hypothetical protein
MKAAKGLADGSFDGFAGAKPHVDLDSIFAGFADKP